MITANESMKAWRALCRDMERQRNEAEARSAALTEELSENEGVLKVWRRRAEKAEQRAERAETAARLHAERVKNWKRDCEKADEEVARLRAALEELIRQYELDVPPNGMKGTVLASARQALAPDPARPAPAEKPLRMVIQKATKKWDATARPATEPDIIFDSPEAEAKFWRTAADEPQEDDDR